MANAICSPRYLAPASTDNAATRQAPHAHGRRHHLGRGRVNAFTQPRQDALLKEMQLDTVLGGTDA
jgi:hypothetical protein